MSSKKLFSELAAINRFVQHVHFSGLFCTLNILDLTLSTTFAHSFFNPYLLLMGMCAQSFYVLCVLQGASSGSGWMNLLLMCFVCDALLHISNSVLCLHFCTNTKSCAWQNKVILKGGNEYVVLIHGVYLPCSSCSRDEYWIHHDPDHLKVTLKTGTINE